MQYYKFYRNWRKFKSRQLKASNDEHSAKQLNFYSRFIQENDLCFDIGANIGNKTDLFLQLGAVVVAVEPQESCWRVLRRRFNNDSVYVESVALDCKNGSTAIFIDRSHTLASISQDWITAVKQSGRFRNHEWAGKLYVKTTTLNDLIKKYGKPTFCKIDVEGAEYQVLQGLSQTIDTISIEFVSERIDASIKCIDYLSNLGEAEFNYYLGDSMFFTSLNWFNSRQIKSVLETMDKNIENFGEIYIRFNNGLINNSE
jgi:FkbM family methyltransferase